MGGLLAVQSDVVAIGGVTGMCLGAFMAALRLMSAGTARIDASAESRVVGLEEELERIERRHQEEMERVERRHEAERKRWAQERAELLGRIERLEARVNGIEGP